MRGEKREMGEEIEGRRGRKRGEGREKTQIISRDNRDKEERE